MVIRIYNFSVYTGNITLFQYPPWYVPSTCTRPITRVEKYLQKEHVYKGYSNYRLISPPNQTYYQAIRRTLQVLLGTYNGPLFLRVYLITMFWMELILTLSSESNLNNGSLVFENAIINIFLNIF